MYYLGVTLNILHHLHQICTILQSLSAKQSFDQTMQNLGEWFALEDKKIVYFLHLLHVQDQ